MGKCSIFIILSLLPKRILGGRLSDDQGLKLNKKKVVTPSYEAQTRTPFYLKGLKDDNDETESSKARKSKANTCKTTNPTAILLKTTQSEGESSKAPKAKEGGSKTAKPNTGNSKSEDSKVAHVIRTQVLWSKFKTRTSTIPTCMSDPFHVAFDTEATEKDTFISFEISKKEDSAFPALKKAKFFDLKNLGTHQGLVLLQVTLSPGPSCQLISLESDIG